MDVLNYPQKVNRPNQMIKKLMDVDVKIIIIIIFYELLSSAHLKETLKSINIESDETTIIFYYYYCCMSI
jgi:hypothetical protein